VLWEGTGKQEGPEFSTDDADTILESYARRATCQWGLEPLQAVAVALVKKMVKMRIARIEARKRRWARCLRDLFTSSV